ncbi:50S ribosomal protein L34e [Candidatus Woesearchaeota archaeon]|nr:50S ribosomal protein L34e [Candidatus Woesearchaeota archaeon]
MVEGKLRSRTFRRIKVKTPGARVTVHYRRRKPNFAECGNCGVRLKAVPRALPFELKNMPKSAKRPERPFGGVLCSACMRAEIVARVRND